ncbi:MAG: hypothetical protein C4530_17360 [Desulfobacteraceae bacterium]|nr:MAG: hypothetical protein C4530_17360 [Desulfobacteraceae bacterium]
MDIDAQTTIQALKTYKAQITEMDRKVQLFLSDRQRHPYPKYQELIDEIRRFENGVYRIKFGFQNTEVHMRLDSLMHSLLVYEQAWKRLFERDLENYQKGRSPSLDSAPPEPPAEERHPLIDKVYAFARKKWAESGIEEIESREALAKRLLPEYQSARKSLKEGERISVVYDPGSRRVKLTVKKS